VAINNNFPNWPLRAGAPVPPAKSGAKMRRAGVDGKYRSISTGPRQSMPCSAGPRAGGSGAGMRPCRRKLPMLAWYTNRAGYLAAIGRPRGAGGPLHPTQQHVDGRTEGSDPSATQAGWQFAPNARWIWD